MYASYHNHTTRCGHASGTEREFVERAIESGYTIFGFSDHTPQFYEGDYYPVRSKMRPEAMDGYVDTVLALKKEYERDIKIRLGLEVEYYPARFGRLSEFLSQYPLEYMLLGQHFIRNEQRADGSIENSCFFPSDNASDLACYASQCAEALETGRFLYFAHPDVFHFSGEKEVYREIMRPLIVRAKELDIPLEISLLGTTEGRHYPNPWFWEMVSEIGNDVVYGADAHRIDRVADLPAQKKAEEMAERFHLHVLTDLEDRFK